MTPRFAAAAMVAMWIMSGPVSAQTHPDGIPKDLKPGQKVSVIDEHGTKLRGRVVDLSGDALTIANGTNRTTVPHTSVLRVDLVDDLRKGVGIGALVGAGLFAIEAWAAHEDGLTLNAAGYGVVAALYCGLGAAVGAGIDALVGGDRTVYQRSRTSRFNLAPVLGPRRVGAVAGITW